MDTKGIIIAIVTIAIGVILTTGVLIPVIQDVSSNDTDMGVKKVCTSGTTTWVVTNDGRLFGCGLNLDYQQGSGDAVEKVSTFTQRLENEKIKDVVANSGLTWVLTEDGKLFGCGSNGYGQQGIGTYDTVQTFTQHLENEKIKEISGIGSITWIITTDGKLYSCGKNTSSEQGVYTEDHITEFTQNFTGGKVKEVINNDHNTTWIITEDGKLFSCGNNGYGEQGIPVDGNNVTVFTPRLENETVKKVEYSGSETWVVTTDGKLFGCGRNNWGEQGSGTSGADTNVTEFTQRLTNENIKDVFSSGQETWVVTTDGKLFGCGRNNYGQQGSGDTANVTEFTQRLNNESVEKVYPSTTTFVITTDGKLFSCGRNNNYQQGISDTSNVTEFTQRLVGETVKDLTFSSGTTGITTVDGKLFMYGSNSGGNQGSGDTQDVQTITQRAEDLTVDKFAMDRGCSWIITDDGRLFGCGRNDGGQQGLGVDDQTINTFTEHDFGEPESSNSVSPTISAMLSVIPLIVIVGLIVATVGYFIKRQ